MKNNIILIFVVIAIAVVSYMAFTVETGDNNTITNFEECKNAGYPIMESYPEQCRTPDGKNFVRDITKKVSGIRGTVLLGPLCPVVREGEECPDRPFETKLSVTKEDETRPLLEFNSRADGTFEIDLPVGGYTIQTAEIANVLPYCNTTEIITVEEGIYTETTVYCDTGIR